MFLRSSVTSTYVRATNANSTIAPSLFLLGGDRFKLLRVIKESAICNAVPVVASARRQVNINRTTATATRSKVRCQSVSQYVDLDISKSSTLKTNLQTADDNSYNYSIAS